MLIIMCFYLYILALYDYGYLSVTFELVSGERQCWNISITDDMTAESSELFLAELTTIDDDDDIIYSDIAEIIILDDDDGN